ncbi:MAG: S49 family peptidase, partial [Burkholderiaceae bacterium]|nr:S49 family peptidase [Burkholderiaceae bacterium]
MTTPDDDLPPPMRDPIGVPPVMTAEAQPLFAELARDFLRERRAERRWRVFFRLFWLTLAGLLVYSLWA